MTDHFKKHGIIHLLWIIAVLVIACALLVSRSDGSQDFTEHVAFASSISSIILAVIAIFYSMISNHGFGASIGKLELSSSTISESANKLSTSIIDFVKDVESLKEGVARVPSTVDEMKIQFSKQLNEMAANTTASLEKPADSPDKKMIHGSLSNGTIVALYALKRAYLEKRKFKSSKLPIDSYLQGIIMGTLSTITMFTSANMEIDKENGEFLVKSLGKFTIEEIDSWTDSEDEYVVKNKAKIDEHFTVTTAAATD